MAYNLRPRSSVQVETLGPLDQQESAQSSVKEKKNWSDSGLLILLVLFRWMNVGLVQTSFVPDEYWQSVEVAHKVVFGYPFRNCLQSQNAQILLVTDLFSHLKIYLRKCIKRTFIILDQW